MIAGALIPTMRVEPQEPKAPAVAEAPAATPAPAAETPAAPVTPADAPAAVPTTPSVVETPPATPAATEPKKEPTAAELAVRNMAEPSPAAVVWDDGAKKILKDAWGVEDPVAWKAQIDQQLAQVDILRQDATDGVAYKKAVESLSPAAAQFFKLELQGKKEEALAYIRSLPNEVLENKAAKDIAPRQLIDTYLKGKMTAEDYAAMADPDTEPSVVQALKEKEKHYAAIAADMHEAKLGAVAKENERQAAEEKAIHEATQKAQATAVAQAKNHPLTKAFVTPAVVDQYMSGQLARKQFVSEDGITPSAQQLTNLLKAEHFDEVMAAQKAYWYEKGKEDGAQVRTALAPSAGSGSGRAVASPPQEEQDPAKKILQEVARRA